MLGAFGGRDSRNTTATLEILPSVSDDADAELMPELEPKPARSPGPRAAYSSRGYSLPVHGSCGPIVVARTQAPSASVLASLPGVDAGVKGAMLQLQTAAAAAEVEADAISAPTGTSSHTTTACMAEAATPNSDDATALLRLYLHRSWTFGGAINSIDTVEVDAVAQRACDGRNGHCSGPAPLHALQRQRAVVIGMRDGRIGCVRIALSLHFQEQLQLYTRAQQQQKHQQQQQQEQEKAKEEEEEEVVVGRWRRRRRRSSSSSSSSSSKRRRRRNSHGGRKRSPSPSSSRCSSNAQIPSSNAAQPIPIPRRPHGVTVA